MCQALIILNGYVHDTVEENMGLYGSKNIDRLIADWGRSLLLIKQQIEDDTKAKGQFFHVIVS